ncbi:MAG TPA: hypothetical protein VH500_00270 [Nitrososphaeraceae archaeon]|jgi:hypothetical protein
MDKCLVSNIHKRSKRGVTRIRKEHQEYPNKRFDEAMEENLPTVIKMREVPKDV